MIKIINKGDKISGNTAVCLGKFDGLHRGHRKIIDACVKEKQNGLSTVVLTFEDNPKFYLNEEKPPLNLMSTSIKLALLEDMGVDYTYMPDFSDIKDMQPQEFVLEILKGFLHAKKVFCGYNFRFGKNAKGNADVLREICGSHGIETTVVDAVTFGGAAVNSGTIRELLLSGDIQRANLLLTRPFSYDFIVEHGNKLGRKIGIPTINQIFPKRFLMPKYGVYAGFCEFDGRAYYSVTNIGVRPTVGGIKPLSETWIPEYISGLLYGKKVKVNLTHYLREEKKFNSYDSLKDAIENNAKESKRLFETSLESYDKEL